VGSLRECTRILGLDGYQVKQIEWEAEGSRAHLWIWLERRGIRGYACSGCGRRTWQVRDIRPRIWDDLPWAAHRVSVIYPQRRVRCRTCGIRTERVAFADPKARVTRRLRQVIGLDCQSMPTSHAAVRHGVSWSKARRAEKAFLTDWDRTRPKRRPRHLGADEIYRGKRQKFYTVLSDLVPGASSATRPSSPPSGLAPGQSLRHATWGEERIAAELLLKLGIRVSPRTVRRYMSRGDGGGGRARSQTWSTFIQNHARAVLACDFFVAVTLRFQLLYVFVVLEVQSRRIIHWNLTDEPTAEWTRQQLRMATPGDPQHRFLIHDRDSIFSEEIDDMLTSTDLTVLKTPARVPQANAHCERLIGTIRRECLDCMIPFNETHLGRILHEWVKHYNRGRPHSSLGPGIPERPTAMCTERSDRHHIPAGLQAVEVARATSSRGLRHSRSSTHAAGHQ
jgi:transposase InsO family protein